MHCIYSTDHRLRHPQSELSGGQLVTPFECPKRAEIIRARWDACGLGPLVNADDFGMAPVLAVHDAQYLDFLCHAHDDWVAAGFAGEAIPTVWPSRSMPSPHIPRDIEGRLGYYALAGETSLCAGTWQAALASKNVGLSATRRVLDGDNAAFGLCRPPGHHASRDQYGGYCFINNAAVAAQYARDQGRQCVAVLDVDFHHGNGTQAIFYDRDDVVFLSLHGDPLDAFPHFLGHADETGMGAGIGSTHNYPLPRGCRYADWRAALVQAMEQIARAGCDFLIVSLGVDTFELDPISFFKLTSDDFTDYGQLLAELRLPTVFVMEGGYAVSEIGVNTVNVLGGFQSS